MKIIIPFRPPSSLVELDSDDGADIVVMAITGESLQVRSTGTSELTVPPLVSISLVSTKVRLGDALWMNSLDDDDEEDEDDPVSTLEDRPENMWNF